MPKRQTASSRLWSVEETTDLDPHWRPSEHHVPALREHTQPDNDRLRQRAALSHMNWITLIAPPVSHSEWFPVRSMPTQAPTLLPRHWHLGQRPAVIHMTHSEEDWGEAFSLEPSALVQDPSALVQSCFSELAQVWRDDTRFLSSLDEVWDHFAYRTIICLGKKVLPLILDEVRRGYAFWDRALIAITNTNPAIDTTSPEEAVAAWIRWGEDNGWLGQ